LIKQRFADPNNYIQKVNHDKHLYFELKTHWLEEDNYSDRSVDYQLILLMFMKILHQCENVAISSGFMRIIWCNFPRRGNLTTCTNDPTCPKRSCYEMDIVLFSSSLFHWVLAPFLTTNIKSPSVYPPLVAMQFAQQTLYFLFAVRAPLCLPPFPGLIGGLTLCPTLTRIRYRQHNTRVLLVRWKIFFI